MVNSATDPVTVNDTTKLVKDIAELYLSEKFSDITLIVGKEKIFAHKVRESFVTTLVLQSGQNVSGYSCCTKWVLWRTPLWRRKRNRSGKTPKPSNVSVKILILVRTWNNAGYYSRRLAKRPQIPLHRLLLVFFFSKKSNIVSGSITITSSDLDSILELIGLAHQFSLTDLEVAAGNKIKSNLNLKNICTVLNTANLYELTELRDACHSFMDQHASEILNDDCFNNLSQVKPKWRVFQYIDMYFTEILD